jgi:hypothetical protein
MADGRALPAGGGTLLPRHFSRKLIRKAILLCERTIIESGTGQISLIGLFDELEVRAVPGTTGPFTVFLLLTDGIVGYDYEVSVEIHDLGNDVVIARATEPRLKWKDRLTTAHLLFPVSQLEVAHAGTYDIVVFADRREVERQRLVVLVPESLEDEEEQENE